MRPKAHKDKSSLTKNNFCNKQLQEFKNQIIKHLQLDNSPQKIAIMMRPNIFIDNSEETHHNNYHFYLKYPLRYKTASSSKIQKYRKTQSDHKEVAPTENCEIKKQKSSRKRIRHKSLWQSSDSKQKLKSKRQQKFLNFILNTDNQTQAVEKRKKAKRPLIIFQNQNVLKKQNEPQAQLNKKGMTSLINIEKIRKVRQQSGSEQKVKMFVLSKNRQVIKSNLLNKDQSGSFINSRERKQISRRLLASIAKTKYLCEQTSHIQLKNRQNLVNAEDILRQIPSQLGVTKISVRTKGETFNLISKSRLPPSLLKPTVPRFIPRSQTDKLLLRSFTHNKDDITPWEQDNQQFYDHL